MGERCGVEHPSLPGLSCDKRPDGHIRHKVGNNITWPDTREQQRREVAQVSHPGATPTQIKKGIKDLADRVNRPPEAFRREDDPQTSHDAITAYEPKRGTAKARVLAYLRDRLGEWVDAPVLTAEDVGGFAGTRRLRELREAGWPIETRQKPGDSNTWQHRLVEDLAT